MQRQNFNYAKQADLGNDDSTNSEFRITEREARSIPRPLWRGASPPFDFDLWGKALKPPGQTKMGEKFWESLLITSTASRGLA
jgi:hypothetical protein